MIGPGSGAASGTGLPTITARTHPPHFDPHPSGSQRDPIRHDRHGRLSVDIHPARMVVLDAWVFQLSWTYPVENIVQQFHLGQVGKEEHIQQTVIKRGVVVYLIIAVPIKGMLETSTT